METALTLDPQTQLVIVDDPNPTISVQWDNAAQQAVINTAVGPTIASRAYGIVHTALFDAWAAYDPVAISTQLGDDLQRPEAENTEANKIEAMSFAAYRVLSELFPDQVDIFDQLMAELGFDPDNNTQDVTTAAGVGNISAEALLAFRRQDGSNQLNNYEDTTGYQPTNANADEIIDIAQWTPEKVPIDDPNGPLEKFLTPQWGQVTPFGLESGDQLRPISPQPFLLVDDATINLEDKTITLENGEVVEISQDIVGTIINPEFIAQAEEVIDLSANLTDQQKLVAEFWEDGGGTAFPPGTWMTFGQFVSARDDHSLDQDAKLFFTLGNAVFDAGVTTWEAKVNYNYVRPVRAIRSLGELGLIGEFNSDLGGYAIEAWGGPEQGTQTILATDFITYQTPGSDPSPPFAEYTSGHSSFSAAGATILELLTGSGVFEASVTFAPGESRFEPGFTPQAEVTLVWDTFSAAADEAGESRLYGGIHFTEGDLNGRTLGQQVGIAVFEQAQFFIEGGRDQSFQFGGHESDELVGGATNEIFYGLAGNDVIAGGLGNDEIFGGDGDDLLRGDRNQRKSGGPVDGDDIIYGGDGNDRIGGKGGDDKLYGEDGNDQMWGDAGDDLLWGGLGDDTLTGDNDSDDSGGVDIFVLAIGDGFDTVRDFRLGEDLIGLFGALSFGQLSISDNQDGALISFQDEALAILNGVEANGLVESSFISV